MDNAKLRHALDQLSDADDALWIEGRPRISVVRAISPEFSAVTRADLDAAGRVRRTRQEPEQAPAPAPARDPDNPIAQAQPEQVAQAEPVAEIQAQPEPAPAPRNLETECEVAENAMIAQREIVKQAKIRAQTARHAFALALRNWQNNSGAPVDNGELMRRHARSQYEHRAAVARGEIDPNAGRVNSTGPSILDRTAAATAGHRGPGGGRSFSRGAYPSQRQGGYAARPKVPSER
jgi:hypothetical protein